MTELTRTKKHDAMQDWLEANPGKEPTDWLLEVRCKDDKQRAEFKELLEKVEACGQKEVLEVAPQDWVSNICGRIDGQPDCMLTSEQLVGEDVSTEFDFRYGRHYFDLDAPDSIFENVDPRQPWLRAIEYLRWKACKLGLEDTTFVLAMREQNSIFKFEFKHWKELERDMQPD